MPKIISRAIVFLNALIRAAFKVFFVVLSSIILTPVFLYTRAHTRTRTRGSFKLRFKSFNYSIAIVFILSAASLLSIGYNLAKPITTDATATSTVNFQARLETADGAIAPDGNYNVEFKLYTASSGGSPIWTEDHLDASSSGVTVSNGYLTVNLGSVTAFTSSIPWDQQLYLTMNIGGTSSTPSWDGEMAPRLLLTAVPYAFQAANASQLQVTNGSNVATLGFASPPTSSLAISLPDTAGTVCLDNTSACDFAPTTLGTGYIQNGTGLQSSANDNIQSNATGSITSTITALGSQTADLLRFENSSGSAALSGINSNGQLYYQSGSFTGTIAQTTLTSASAIYDLPNFAGTQTICTIQSGNCAGSGGGDTGSGTANAVAVFSGTNTLTTGKIFDNGTDVSIGDSTIGSSLLNVGTANQLTVDGSGNLDTAGNLTGFTVTTLRLNLIGGFAPDITDAAAPTANNLTIAPGDSTNAASGTGASLNLNGGNQTGTVCSSGCIGGSVNILGGNATGSGLLGGGSVNIDSGTGSFINGSISIGTTNAVNIIIGKSASTTAVNGGLTVAGVLTANGAVNLAANQSLTLASGTGQFKQTYATSTANTGAQLLAISNTNSSTGITVQGINITPSNATPSSGTNTLNLYNFAAGSALGTGATTNGINFASSTGYTNFIKTPSFILSNLGAITGAPTVDGATLSATTVDGATLSSSAVDGTSLSGGSVSGGSLQGGTFTATTADGLNVSSTVVGGTGALNVSAGGSSSLTLTSGSGNIITASTINGDTLSATAAVFPGSVNIQGTNALTLGTIAGSGSPTAGQLLFGDGTTDNHSLTLEATPGSLLGSTIIQIPYSSAGTDTVCLLTINNCSGGNISGSGTANAVAEFSASNTITTGLIFDNGTDVSIGDGNNYTSLLGVGTSDQLQVDSSGNLSTSGNVTAPKVTSTGALTLQSNTSSALSLTSGSTLSVASNNLNLSTAGVLTLAGGQSTDLTTANDTTLTVSGGVDTLASGIAPTTTISAANETGTTCTGLFGCLGGQLKIISGSATNATGSTGGNLTLDAGTGATANGLINIGTTNASSVNIGTSTNTTTIAGNLTVDKALGLIANQNLTLASGTGEFIQTYSIGTANTGAQVLTYTNSNAGVGVTVQGVDIIPANTVDSSGNNTLDLYNFAAGSALGAREVTNGINFASATGYTNFIDTPTFVLSSLGAITGAPTVDGATLSSTTVDGATLSSTTVDGATLSSTTVDGATLSSTTVDGATLSSTKVDGLGVSSTTVTGTTTLSLVSTGTNTASLDTGSTGGIVNVGATNAATVNIGGATASTVNLGTAAADNVNVGSGVTSGTVNLGAAVTTGAVNLGVLDTSGLLKIGGVSETGTLTVGQSTSTNTIAIGAGASGATTVNIANGSVSDVVSIGAALNTGTITIGGTSQTGNLLLQGESITDTITGSSSAPSDTIKTSTNSATAFQVQNSVSANILDVNTSGQVVAINQLSAPGTVTPTLLSAPISPSTTPHGTTGSTSYTYNVSAVMSSGYVSAISASASTSTGNAILTGSNFNTISWTAVTGATSYNVYRSSTSITSVTTGLIGNTTSTSLNDTGLTATTPTPSAASLSSSTTYFYKITALDSLGGETTTSTEVSQTVGSANQAIGLSWPAVSSARSYKVYRGTGAGAENIYFTTSTNSYTDYGTATSTSASVPTTNTAYSTDLTNSANAQITIGGTGSMTTAQVFVGGNTPAPVTVTNTGTAGVITYSYQIVGVNSAGSLLPPPYSGGSTGTGNSTLSGTNFNVIRWSTLASAVSYNIYRTGIDPGGSPSTTGLIGNTAALTFNDTGLAASGSVPISSIGTANYGSCGTQFNVITQGNYAYTSGLQIYDISNPSSPVQVYTNNTTTCAGFNLAAVQGRYAYGTTNTTPDDLQVYDISNPTSPTLVSSIPIPFNSAMLVQGRYAYIGGFTGFMGNTELIYDLSNPASPALVGSIPLTNGTSGTIVQGKYFYTQSGGLSVIDISNPSSPVTDSVTTSIGITPQGMEGDYLYGTDLGTNSFMVVNISNPFQPILVSNIPLEGNGNNGVLKLALSGNYAYITNCGFNGADSLLEEFDISDPALPNLVGVTTTARQPEAITVEGNYAYVLGFSQFSILNLGGTYTQSLQVGSAEISNLDVNGTTSIDGNASVLGSLSVGQSIQASGNLGVSGSTLLQGTTSLVGGILGGVSIGGISTPSTPTVTSIGTNGSSSTWSYKIVAVSASGGTTPASVVGSISSSDNATLSSSNYNAIVWTPVTGAVSYNVYRTAVGTSPTTTGLIGSTSSDYFTDTGLAGNSATAPTLDTSGQLTVNGIATFEDDTNSATAFQVQNSGASTILDVNTSASLVCIDSTACTAHVEASGTEALGVSGAIVASGSVVSSGSPDYAENITASDPTIGAGTLVSADPNNPGSVVKSAIPYDPDLIGAISTSPSFLANGEGIDGSSSANQVPLALTGRVPVNVNTENGDIAVGDYITSSSTPGVGMKATRAGTVIGQALQSYSGSGTGSILVFIETQYYSPTSADNLQGGGQGSFTSLQVSGQATVGSLTVAGDTNITGNLIVTGTTTVANLTIDGHIITAGTVPPTVSLGSAACQNASASISGNDTAGSVTLSTNAVCTSAGSLANIAFGTAYGAPPHIILTPTTSAAASLQYFNGQSTPTNFTIDSASPPNGQSIYSFTYHVEQ